MASEAILQAKTAGDSHEPLRKHYPDFQDGERNMERICFLLKVKQHMMEDYKRAHAQVWPEMLEALRQTGWHNYSLFLGPDGLLVGYLETQDFARALAGMKKHSVNERWQKEMSSYFEGLDGGPDDNMVRLEEVFHLEE